LNKNSKIDKLLKAMLFGALPFLFCSVFYVTLLIRRREGESGGDGLMLAMLSLLCYSIAFVTNVPGIFYIAYNIFRGGGNKSNLIYVALSICLLVAPFIHVIFF
jgi:hypothetical protein